MKSTWKKVELMRESAEKGWLGFLYHELDPNPGRIVADGKRFHFEPVED